MLLLQDLYLQNYQQRELRAFELHTFIPILNMFMPNFVAFFVASGMALLKSCCISEGDTSSNLLFLATFPGQNLNFAAKFCSHTDTWRTAFQNVSYLTTIHRSGDG